eukprot:scaffold24662_cov115-Isochrysis_galbana.AAC.2
MTPQPTPRRPKTLDRTIPPPAPARAARVMASPAATPPARPARPPTRWREAARRPRQSRAGEGPKPGEPQ